MIGIDWQLGYTYVKWSPLENAILVFRIEALSSQKLDAYIFVRHVVTNAFSHVQNEIGLRFKRVRPKGKNYHKIRLNCFEMKHHKIHSCKQEHFLIALYEIFCKKNIFFSNILSHKRIIVY